jgi:hypothetical protein
MSKRWCHFAIQVLIGFVVAIILMLVPLPLWTPWWFAYFQVPVVMFLFICYIGVLLYDTLFYNRYLP